MTAEEIFKKGLLYHHYANTAYPLTPKSFMQYRITGESKIENFLKSEWAKADALSLYLHIPFCSVRCKFCEYTVLENSDTAAEDLYVSLLIKEMEMYAKIIKDKKIIGYDLGGGTPTKLSVENLKKLTGALTSKFNFDKDVIFSIETTPVIAAAEPGKLVEVFNMGYRRISMGIQTVSEKLLNELGREGTTHIYEKAVANIRNAGFKRFNIDLMYGFLYQNDEDFENTLKYAITLNPDYITLYRNRYKGTKIENEAEGVSLYKIICQYNLAYKILTGNDYEANVGKNTFSKIKGDYGTSDYLTRRVIDGTPYVGMGLGAQSFGMDYLAYNDGAASKKLAKYQEKIENNIFPIQDIYELDKEESIAKMVSVAFYFAFVDLDAFQKRFGLSFTTYFKEEVDFLTGRGLMEIRDSRIYLTERGADYINGIIPLFYSRRSKAEMLELIKNKPERSNGEQQFLKAYNINDYRRPSLAADILLISVNRESNNKLSVLLIKRGEHPFMNQWALPGGFVKPGESVDQAARRELEEETGAAGVSLSQLQVFSEPGRDPRGWIISCAFLGLTNKDAVDLQFGDDALDAQWFDINYKRLEAPDGYGAEYRMELTRGDAVLKAAIAEKSTENYGHDFQLLSSEGIAFDHAKIIACGLFNLNL